MFLAKMLPVQNLVPEDRMLEQLAIMNRSRSESESRHSQKGK